VANQRTKNYAIPRAVTYIRFAVADTDGSKEAVARHICQRRANELGAIVVSVYIDVASGWEDDRKHLRRMLSDITESGEITYVIVPDHSTIAHTMHLYGGISWKLEQAGARLIVATVPLENYRALKPNQHGVLHAVADWAAGEPSRESTDQENEQSGTVTPNEAEDDD
jgi:resolvase-like protein